jgi:16S rRNA (cytosine1402-N4)-methyltransferase
MNTVHKTVLLHEVIDGLAIKEDETVLDATLGGGGHSKAALARLGHTGKLVALDADNAALERAEVTFKEVAKKSSIKIILEKSNFKDLDKVLEKHEIKKVDRIIFDLGLSTDEIESSGRGFSFRRDEPLIMTFSSDPTEEDLTAREIVNSWDQENIETIIKAYGEERYARKIAAGIVRAREIRPIETTFELVEIIKSNTPRAYHFGRIHPATRTFQALRMTVNDEVGVLTVSLEKAFEALSPGGRMAVISFHSIEDRIVKFYFKKLKEAERAILINKKPIIPTDAEVENNPKSRSAKLRIIEKIN